MLDVLCIGNRYCGGLDRFRYVRISAPSIEEKVSLNTNVIEVEESQDRARCLMIKEVDYDRPSLRAADGGVLRELSK